MGASRENGPLSNKVLKAVTATGFEIEPRVDSQMLGDGQHILSMSDERLDFLSSMQRSQ